MKSEPDDLACADNALVSELATRLLHGNFATLSAREQRVIAAIARRQPSSRSLNRTVAETDTFGDHIADRVARFGGSWAFILIFVGGLIAWIAINTVMLARYGSTFDVYPFIFLNLILSMIAALQAPVILMSQNRQANRDRVSAGLDYEVNLKAELEIMTLHEKLDGMRIDQLWEMLEDQREKLDRLVDHVGVPPPPGAR
ncbi:DUF1003 domain-containing protein [Sphingomonas sp. RB3P16]|uniref:DUF1003 domain-containing protein n=1 Tax=Parasphingomonas frigoris TaxID=3096163 RepID=UPI002FC81E5A